MQTSICAVLVCPRFRQAQNWCLAHYLRWKRTGSPGTTPIVKQARRAKGQGPAKRRKSPKTCSVPTCELDSRRNGMCATHDHRLKVWGDVHADIPIDPWGRKPFRPCGEPGCPNKAKTRGRCPKHYEVVKRQEIKADPARLARHKETQYTCSRRWREANRERAQLYQRLWRINNPNLARGKDRRRAEQLKAAPKIPFTLQQFTERMAYFGNCCWMCGGPAETMDHVKPISKGGAHALMNLRPACMPCNSSKRDKWPFPLQRAA